MFCTKCGKENPDGTMFCGECGAQMGGANPTPQVVQAQQVPPQQNPQPTNPVNQPNPVSTSNPVNQPNPISSNNQSNNTEPKPKSDGKYAVMSVGEYFGSMLIMAIPVIGWIFAIIWALGGTKKVNKANLARATLINIVICIAIWIAVGSAVKLVADTLVGAVGGFIPGMGTSEGFDIDSLFGGDANSLDGMLDSLMQQLDGGGYTSL